MVKKLTQDIFLQSFEYVPRVGISLLIRNQKGEVLLAQRAIPPLKNSWHLPGSFLLKGEEIIKCIQRVFKDELGVVISDAKPTFVCVSEDLDRDPRGHVIDLIYQYMVEDNHFKPTEQTKALKFFDKLPENVSFKHEDLLQSLGYK